MPRVSESLASLSSEESEVILVIFNAVQFVNNWPKIRGQDS